MKRKITEELSPPITVEQIAKKLKVPKNEIRLEGSKKKKIKKKREHFMCDRQVHVWINSKATCQCGKKSERP